jgi:hypothetical protein
MGFLFGDAGLSGIALVCDAAEGVFDRQPFDDIGVIFVEPFRGLGMVRVARIGNGVEGFVEAGDAVAILGRRVPFAADVARIGDAGLALADDRDGQPMFPGVTEVVKGSR